MQNNSYIIEQQYMFVSSPYQQYPQVAETVSTIENQLGHHNNDYLFLRSVWKSHSHTYTHAVVDLDDKLDRLNKIVAMMKKHINYSASRELQYQNNTAYPQSTIRQNKSFEAMNNALLQAEQYRTALIMALQKNQQLSKCNSALALQIQQLRKQNKQQINQVKKLTEKNIQLQNKLLSKNYEESNSNFYMRSSRGSEKACLKDIQIDENNSIISMSNSIIHIPKLPTTKSQGKLKYTPKYRYNKQDEDNWLNQSSIISQCDLNDSIISVTKYGFFNQAQVLHKHSSCKQNKQNFDQTLNQQDTQRNLTKQRSVKHFLRLSKDQQQIMKQSVNPKLKFIRQNSKKQLLRTKNNMQTMNQTTNY